MFCTTKRRLPIKEYLVNDIHPAIIKPNAFKDRRNRTSTKVNSILTKTCTSSKLMRIETVKLTTSTNKDAPIHKKTCNALGNSFCFKNNLRPSNTGWIIPKSQ